MLKKFLSEVADGLTPSTWWDHNQFGTNKEASLELKQLFEGDACFQTPKPVRLLQKIIAIASRENDIVLDFFAGSGTTGDAVLSQNGADSGKRRYILVQLPEVLDLNNKDQEAAAEYCEKIGRPRNIAELTKERLRRSANKFKSANPLFGGDLGFRVFKLDTSNIRPWNPRVDDLQGALFAHQEHLAPCRSSDDILYEILLKLGLDLCTPIETREIAGKPVSSVGAGVLLSTAGEVIAFIPNEIGKALLYNERL